MFNWGRCLAIATLGWIRMTEGKDVAKTYNVGDSVVHCGFFLDRLGVAFSLRILYSLVHVTKFIGLRGPCARGIVVEARVSLRRIQ